MTDRHDQQKMLAINVASALKEAQANQHLREELIAHMARELKVQFDALVAAGFNADQALELLKAKAL